MNGEYTVRTTVTNAADGGTDFDYVDFTITLMNCLTDEAITIDTAYFSGTFPSSTPFMTGIIPGSHSTSFVKTSLFDRV